MNNLSSPYGAYCPQCYAPITGRERSLNGLNTCANGHRTPMGAGLSLDQAAHLRFKQACLEKLTLASLGGQHGWEDPQRCTDQSLAVLLMGAVRKGDMRDVANYAMFLHERGAPCESLFKKVGFLPANSEAIYAKPTSGEMITIKVWGRTDAVGSECDDELEIDKLQWELATPEERNAWASEQAHNLIEWGYEEKTDE